MAHFYIVTVAVKEWFDCQDNEIRMPALLSLELSERPNKPGDEEELERLIYCFLKKDYYSRKCPLFSPWSLIGTLTNLTIEASVKGTTVQVEITQPCQ